MGARIRLYNPDWTNCTDLTRQDVHGNNKQYFEIFYSGTASATATEIGAAADAILDGTTTPVLLYVESTDAKDTLAGVGTQKVRLIGVSVASAADYLAGKEAAVYSVEEIEMATSAHKLTTRYYLRVIKLYGSSWGAETDTAGTLTVGNDATPTTTYLTIAAASNESNGGSIWGCDGRYGRWSLLDISHQDTDHNNV